MGTIRNADVSPVASHTFTNSFALDYGLFDNLTIGGRLPLVAKFDTEDSLTAYSLGDISSTVRYQPFEYMPGKLSQTWFGSLKLKTGDSPYEIDTDESLSTGSGYYTVSGGVSASFQGSFNDETTFVFRSGGERQTSTVGSQMSGIMNFALGVRVSPKTIANVNVGFGMTELSPDIILGLSLPIDIEGVKAPAGS